MSGESQQRREQRDRYEHDDQDRDRRAHCKAAHELDAHQEQTEERDHDRAAGEDDRAAGGVDRAHDGGLRIETLVQALPVAGDDEQRVVDADADAEHRRQLCREIRCRHRVADQLDEADPDADTEQGRDDR